MRNERENRAISTDLLSQCAKSRMAWITSPIWTRANFHIGSCCSIYTHVSLRTRIYTLFRPIFLLFFFVHLSLFLRLLIAVATDKERESFREREREIDRQRKRKRKTALTPSICPRFRWKFADHTRLLSCSVPSFLLSLFSSFLPYQSPWLLHQRSIHSIHLVVKTARVAQVVARTVSSP